MLRTLGTLLFAGLCLTACGGDAPGTSTDNGDAPVKVVLQTDWYAQPEHGGFYQALARGYYAEEGLDVEIRPGANVSAIPQLVASNRVQFSVGAIETMFIYRSRGIPLVSLFPYFQHDPQCVLFHPESGIKTLEDLDGREVMFNPGLVYVDFLEKAMHLDIHVLPMDWSLARYMTDKQFVQQCFLTNEPVIVRRKGIEPGVIPLSESGFDPYRHVYTNAKMIAEQPEVVKGFIRASLRGWDDFMHGDPAPAFELIIASNPQQEESLMREILAQMQAYSLTDGNTDQGETLGQYNVARLGKVLEQLQQLGLLDGPVELRDSIAFDLLPPELVVKETP
ncbi:ABC transporter substrate-binding protein [Haliea sp. E17]|uniref:ABC transporter substrate-binding protein n=1 Tax=Haliea sp. E17 TaxID=3401576 RepID=UPI003AAA933E